MKRAKSTPRLDREVILQAANLSDAEARFLVSSYYAAQGMRKRLDMQLRHLGDVEVQVGTPDDPETKVSGRGLLLNWSGSQFAGFENDMQKSLKNFAEGRRIGRWCMSHVGIGPVITAGLLAHLDITKAPTAGHFWSFSGLNPAQKWEKGEKRPYNAEMKQLCYHLGECFKRVSNDPDSFYGAIYRSRKEFLVKRNEAGGNAERAKTFTTKSNEWKKTLAKGQLPAGNIDRQAANYAAKIFLSHLHAVMYWDRFGEAPPKPFALSILGHAHEIKIPEIDQFPGFEEAYYGKRPILESAA